MTMECLSDLLSLCEEVVKLHSDQAHALTISL